MKTSNYLIVAFAALAFVGCSDNDFIGGDPNITPENQTNGEITFAASNKKLTRADIVGGTAAGMLGNTFVVEGTKGSEAETYPSATVVFDNYVVKYVANTAGTTESNTNNWEYVGQTHDAIGTNKTSQIGRTVGEQTIKYWDYATDQYDFIAYSTGNSTMVAGTDNATESDLSAGEVSVTKIAYGAGLASSATAYRFIGTSVEDLSNCYITDITPVLKAKYNNVVTLKFKNITSKVRVGLYETVPGYSVKDVKFYYDDATTIATGPVAATSGLAGGANKATLFTPSGSSIPQSGTITVRYPHIGSACGPVSPGTNEADYNQASVSVAAGAKSSPYLAFGELTNNYTTAERNEAAGSIYLGRSLPMATFAGESAKNYYTPVLPNTSGENLTLRVDYTLVSTDGSAETIVIHGAKAVIPSTYTQWLNNYAYTYIFKITDNTNGWTSTVTSDPNGLFPITFDAVVKEMVDYDGEQTTVTTVATPSITTYQQGHVYTTNEYATSTGKNIYVQVMNNQSATAALVTGLTDDNSLLYKITKNNADYKASEAEVMDALLKQWTVTGDNIKGRNSVELAKQTNIVNTVTEIVNGVNDDPITVASGSAAEIGITGLTPGTYAYVYDYTTGSKAVVPQYQQIAATAGTTVVTGYYGLAISEIPSSPEASGKANADYIYLSKTYNGAANPTWTQVTVVNGESGTDVTGLYKVAKTTVLAGKVSSAATTAAENTLYFDVYNENNGKYAVKVIKIVENAATAALTASVSSIAANGTSVITYRENGDAKYISSPAPIITKKGKLTAAAGGFDTWKTSGDDVAIAAATVTDDAVATIENNNDGTYTFTGKQAGTYRININGQIVEITVTAAP